LLGQIPLGQPDENLDEFAPSIYAGDHHIGKIYLDIAARIADKLEQ
jgi:ATP-binding protein involved in chromosome partitioning